MTTISPTSTVSTGSVSNALDNTEIASNFTTFLQLLTTQLKNQNPLDPLDTNQFTQQLVEFAQVEQQMKSNDQLSSLVSLEKSAQATTALAYVGATVVVDGSTAQLTNGTANWSLNVTKPSTATITIKDSTGQNVYTGTVAVNPGTQNFTWNGRGNDGRLWPDGAYTLTATAVDANQQSVAISTEVQAVVDSVDLTQDTPQLSINGQNYTLDKIKRIVRPTT
ncbi:MAG: flagellar hook capping FlgD N-terminal domain-containing protein [Pseudolabrys sp.]|jgi:flagellar basal-body rod modification protein FlgD